MSSRQSSSNFAIHGRAQISTLRVREAFIRERFGEAAYRACIDKAGDRLRSVLIAPDPGDGWVSFDMLVDLCEAADREFGHGDDSLILEMGRYSAHHTGGVWRSMFERGMSVHQFMDVAAGIWHRHYDCGRVVVSEARGQEAEMSIDGMPRPHRAHCLSVRGWLDGVFSFSPHTRVEITELACRASGGSRCTMRLSWH